MEWPVAVTACSEAGEDVLRFRGEGTLRRQGEAVHLSYTAAGEGGDVTSAIHLRRGRAEIRTADYRLLLDERRVTQAHLAPELPVAVTAHAVRCALTEGAGEIFLHYTLSAGGRALQTVRLTLAVRPIRRDTI